MAEIYKIKLPSGLEYDIKDNAARSSLSNHEGRIVNLEGAVEGGIHYRGVTTTALTDGATTNPIVIDGESVNVNTGDLVIYHTTSYGDKEFIWNGSKWSEFGAGSALKALAYKSQATGSTSYTPDGNVTVSFTGEATAVSVKGTPTGDIVVSTTGTTNYQPGGSVADPSISLSTATVYSITSVGKLPSCSLPSFGATVNNEILTFSWSEGSWNAGTLPSRSSYSVATGATATAGKFTGTAVRITFDGNELTSTGTYTASGSATGAFSGSAATITITAK